MKTYKATVSINGRYTHVVVQAASMIDARNILEAQYGRGSIKNGPNYA